MQPLNYQALTMLLAVDAFRPEMAGIFWRMPDFPRESANQHREQSIDRKARR